jgi:two-component system chemotaxis sensor kinase CheA
MKRRLALTIYHKLIALIVALMIVVVGGLASYLSSQQITAMGGALRTKATTYGSVMARQTTSAVAFADRETAREVLQSIDADSDVAAVALYSADGEVLYARGTVASKTPPGQLDAPLMITTASRFAAVMPVVSLEGPRGVLVIELSTESLRVARRHVQWLAFLTGLAALAGGCFAAWWIARRLAMRLRAIANVASAVAGGDLSQKPIDDPQRDEIGTLAAAFNAMLAQIKQLIAHVQEMARKEQDRLESLVALRTRELDQRNAEMQMVFDHVDQGLFMVDLDGKIATERSAAVDRMLGELPESGLVTDYVARFAPDKASWFALQWEALREAALPPELCLDQLPSRFEVGRRHLELAYKLTDNNGAQRVLIVITDITAQVQRQRAERDERETASLLSRMLRGRFGFLAFYAEATQYVTEIASWPRSDAAAFKRIVHTLKGISALEGIDSIAEQCHALEAALADGDELATLSISRAIAARWELVTHKIAPLLDAASGRVELMPRDLERIEAALRRGAPTDDLLAMVESWRHERVEHRLQRFADDARVLAGRLGKGTIDVKVDVADDLRLPSERWAGFWTAFVHAIRNAIDHGIESADERVAAGKPATAQLVLHAQRSSDGIAIEIRDDGRGINWDKVAELARARGLQASSEADLVEALFQDGFTTRDVTSEISGRGVGLSALRHACTSTGGHITVTSRVGAGTTFRFRWPGSFARRERLQSAG